MNGKVCSRCNACETKCRLYGVDRNGKYMYSIIYCVHGGYSNQTAKQCDTASAAAVGKLRTKLADSRQHVAACPSAPVLLLLLLLIAIELSPTSATDRRRLACPMSVAALADGG